ncbi:hypothetical protein K2Z83_09255 [Oscillochloris sp. ZM17-4]|nr:hypothetical protein [Oscillochloris sp. ZM17-4]
MSDTFSFKIEVFTDALQILGSYDLPLYRRVSDAINSRLHRFVTLRDASVAPIWKPQQSQRVPQLMVDLTSALLVAVIEEPPSPPGFVAPAPLRDTQPMMFFTSAFAMRADFYKRTDMELVAMLGEMTDDFIPLSNVSVFPLHGGAALSRGFVCLNRTSIQALFAVGAPITNAPVPAPVADVDLDPDLAEETPADDGEAPPPDA